VASSTHGNTRSSLSEFNAIVSICKFSDTFSAGPTLSTLQSRLADFLPRSCLCLSYVGSCGMLQSESNLARKQRSIKSEIKSTLTDFNL